MPGPERPVALGFVDLSGDKRPMRDKAYDIVEASSAKLEDLSFPEGTEFRRLSLDLYNFYVEDLPDFTSNNEGMMKLQINTRNPQDLAQIPTDMTFVTKFGAKDKTYAPSFLYRGVFRNVLFREWINLRIDLYELDTDADVYYDKIKYVIDGVPEIRNLDVLAGIPYVGVATKLFEGGGQDFRKESRRPYLGRVPHASISPGGGRCLPAKRYLCAVREEKHQKEEKGSGGGTWIQERRSSC
jgi:hypothetical protein